MNAILTGTITDIFPAETYGQLQKRVFWLKEQADKYPNHWAIELQNSNMSLIDNFKINDRVTCNINITGRYWEKNGKSGCINTLKCWKIVKDNNVAVGPVKQSSAPQQKEELDNFGDLPF